MLTSSLYEETVSERWSGHPVVCTMGREGSGCSDSDVCIRGAVRKLQRLIEWTAEQRVKKCESLYVISIHAKRLNMLGPSLLIRIRPKILFFLVVLLVYHV